MQVRNIRKFKAVGDTHISIYPTMTISFDTGRLSVPNTYTVSGTVVMHVDADGKTHSHSWTKGRSYKSIDAAKAAAESAFGTGIKWKTGVSDRFLTGNVAGQAHIKKWARSLWKKKQARIAEREARRLQTPAK